MDVIVRLKDDTKKFWLVDSFTYDQGCVHISGRMYNSPDTELVAAPEEIERIWVIFNPDEEDIPEAFRKQLMDVFQSCSNDGKALSIKVETHKTIVETKDLVDWAKVN